LAAQEAYVLDATIPGFCDDLDGGYDLDNGKGYFMRVTPEGYMGCSVKEPHSYGDNQQYICEVEYHD